MSKKKIIAISILPILLILFFCLYCIMLTNGMVNGFTGVFGIIKLNVSGEVYIQLNDDPTVILVRRNDDDIESFMSDYFDSPDSEIGIIWSYKHGGVKNGIRYYTHASAFSRSYWTIMITPIDTITTNASTS